MTLEKAAVKIQNILLLAGGEVPGGEDGWHREHSFSKQESGWLAASHPFLLLLATCSSFCQAPIANHLLRWQEGEMVAQRVVLGKAAVKIQKVHRGYAVREVTPGPGQVVIVFKAGCPVQ